MSKCGQARQFGKLYWDEPGGLFTKAVAAYVRYRCHGGPRIILREEFEAVLGVSHTTASKYLKEAEDLGLIYRRKSARPGDRNKFVFSVEPFDDQDLDGHPSGNLTDTGKDLAGSVKELDGHRQGSCRLMMLR